MSNLQKSSSRFSGRRFAIALVLVVFSTGAAQAENRYDSSAPTSRMGEILNDAWNFFWQLAGGEAALEENLSEEGDFGYIGLESEKDSEIEIEPPRAVAAPGTSGRLGSQR